MRTSDTILRPPVKKRYRQKTVCGWCLVLIAFAIVALGTKITWEAGHSDHYPRHHMENAYSEATNLAR